MLDGKVNDAVEAKALSLNPDHIDIYSASWGPEDDGKTVDGPGPLAKKAFVNGITKGRNGLGSIFIWASGNGGRKKDNCNCDGYTNSIYTLSISSATQAGRKPWYLEECASTLATTYSSGSPGHDASITTVDQDKRLRPDSICTSAHTGTSASAPIAAGIVALVLEANPKLTWRDVQHITVAGGNPGPLSKEAGWSTNGVGKKFSHKFGFGLMDADAMVTKALSWNLVGPQRTCTSPMMDPQKSLQTKDSKETIKQTVNMDSCLGSLNSLEHVQAAITLKQSPRGSLHIVLISPMGTRSSLLLPRQYDYSEAPFNAWPFISVHFWGEPPNGTWTLEVSHTSAANRRAPGILKKWQLTLMGHQANVFPTATPTVNINDIDEQPQTHGKKNLNTIDPRKQSIPSSSVTSVIVNQIYEDQANNVGSDGCHVECKGGCSGGTGPNKCLGCQHHMLDSYCVPYCPKEGFYEAADKSCQPCSSSCEKCYGPRSDQCLSCHPNSNNKLFLSSTGTCVSDCPKGWRPDGEGTSCQPCPVNCANCNADNECDNCDQGLFLTRGSSSRKMCVATCPEGEYGDLLSKSCKPCHKDCETCTGNLATQCAKCKEEHYYHQRICQPEVGSCPSGYFTEPIGECAPCPKGCKTCKSFDSCEECDDDWTLIKGSYCTPSMELKEDCGEDEKDNNKGGPCKNCHASCQECFGKSADKCLRCNPSHPLLHITSCLQECPESTFQDGQECRHCPHACNECKNLDECTSCHGGYYLSNSGHCVPVCPSGQFANQETGKCHDCPKSCGSCLDKERCQTCQEGKVLTSNGQCEDNCTSMPGFYMANQESRCLQCHAACQECTGPGPNECTTCPSGTKLSSHTCLVCPRDQFFDNAISACRACHQDCQTCSGPSSSDCLSCSGDKVHLYDLTGSCLPCCQKNVNGSLSLTCCPCNGLGNACLKTVKGKRDKGSKDDNRSGLGHRLIDKFFDSTGGAGKNGQTLVFFLISVTLTSMAYCLARKCGIVPGGNATLSKRAKWKRGHSRGSKGGPAYTKLPLTSNRLSSSQEDSFSTDTFDGINHDHHPGSDISEEDESDEEEIYIYGDERRRLNSMSMYANHQNGNHFG